MKKILALLALVGLLALVACDRTINITNSQGGNTPTNNQPVDSNNTTNPTPAP